MKTCWIRTDDPKDKTPLSHGERGVGEYDGPYYARLELEDMGGGWLFDKDGKPVEYVKGYKER